MAKKTKDKALAEYKALRRAVFEANLKVTALETLIDVAEETLHINIRQKPDDQQSTNDNSQPDALNG
jgi:transposase